MQELFRYADKTDILLNVAGIFAAVLSGMLYPLTTLIFGELIDTFASWQRHQLSPAGFTSEVTSKSYYFLYLAAAEMAFTYLAMATFVYTGERQIHLIRKNYLRAVLRQDTSWFDRVGAGEITTRLTSDTLLIQDALSEKVSLAVSQIATFLAGFGLAFYRSWRLTLVLLAVIPLIVIAAGISNVIAGKFQFVILAKYSKAGSLAEEVFSAVRTLTAFCAQGRMTERYNANISGATDASIKKEAVSGLGIGFLNAIIYCGYSLTFWYSYHLIENNEISAGAVINVFFAVLIGAFSLGQVAPEMQAVALGRSAAATVFETIDLVPIIDPYDHSGETIPDLKGKIELKDVEFTYPARPESKILKKVNLTVEPGTTVALVGPSGSGKSTIVQLIERFYDPDAGTVMLDGKPLNKLRVNWLRNQIGLVQQEPILFEGSIADNVAFNLAGKNLSKEEIQSKVESACRQANAHDFIMKLSQKYDTQVGARGTLLSGGQKQRIAIARAIVNNPKILLFDEATAALDSNSEAAVQKTLDDVSKAHTTIVVAHRLSTVKNADMIIVMRNGEIAEQGTHASLIEAKGVYSKLVEAQSLSTKLESEGAPESDASVVPQKLNSQPSEKDFVAVNFGNHDQILSSTSALGVYWTVMKLNAPELKYSVPALLSAIVMGISYPLFSIALSSIIEVLAVPGPNLKHDSEMWSSIFLLIGVGTLVFSFLQQFLFGLASSKLTERLRRLLFAALLRQEINYFDKEENSTGALTSKLSSDAQNIQGASGATLGTVLQILTNIIGGMVIALSYGWKLALVAIACLPAVIASGWFRLKIVVYFYEKNKRAYEKSAQLACEAAGGIKTIQSLTYEEEVQHKYDKMLEGPLNDGFKNAWFNSIFYAIAQSITFMVNALIFWYGGQLIAYDGYTIKQFMTVFVAVVFGSMSAGRILAFAPDFNKAKSSADSVISILKRKPIIDPQSTAGTKPASTEVHGAMEFRDVVFYYPQRPNNLVLRKINFKIEPGQFVALVGPSGSGKSTTIQLLERFYDPSSGEILLDGINISEINIGHYRNMIGLVSQEPNLFGLTILENICLGLDTIPPMDDVVAACRSANIHDFIMTLENGYNTSLGGKGTQLSGGQKQRIAIARALIRNPKILLLDEATSALDTESEKVVQQALDAATKGRTTVAIAHRLSTIQHADVIYVLKDGKIVDQGDHNTLFKRKGLYYDLVVQQTLTP